MRTKAGVAALAAACVLGATTGTSYAGEAGIDNDGNFLTADADVSPPVAGTKKKPQPVTLDFHQMFGNYRTGKQPPRSTEIAVRLPRGMTLHPDFVGECPLPATDADIRADRCSASSRVGAGTALADARNLGLPDPIPATVTAFSGAAHNGNPTLLLQGRVTFGGSTVVVEYDFEVVDAASGGFGLRLVTFDPFTSPPPDPNSGYITLNKLDLKVGKNVKRRVSGKRVGRGYLEAPNTCSKAGWAFREEFTLVTGATLLAPDAVACTR
jgi:hypothetical protein